MKYAAIIYLNPGKSLDYYYEDHRFIFYKKNDNGESCHRLNGPAIEYIDGDKEWYKNGKRFKAEYFGADKDQS